MDKKALAEALGIDKRTVQRMVARYELPPPVYLMSKAMWIAGKVLDHISAAADRAAKEAEARAKRLRLSS